jgi:hypothetical protein
MYCEKCGYKLDSDSLFCTFCGVKIELNSTKQENISNKNDSLNEKYKQDIDYLISKGYKKIEVEPLLFKFLWRKGIDVKPPPLLSFPIIGLFSGLGFSILSFIFDYLKYVILNNNLKSILMYIVTGILFGAFTVVFFWYRKRKLIGKNNSSAESSKPEIPSSTLKGSKQFVSEFWTQFNLIFNYLGDAIAHIHMAFRKIPQNNNRPFGRYKDNQEKYNGLVPCHTCNVTVAWGIKSCSNCGAINPHLNFNEELEESKPIYKWIIIIMVFGAIITIFDDSPEYKDCLKAHKRQGIDPYVAAGVCESFTKK